MRILSIGECMAEMAPTGTQNEFHLGYAGDTFNTAWYLARTSPDIDVAYFTAIGDDAISEQMRAAFKANGIDDRHVQTLPGCTVGLYLISLDNGERSFTYWRGMSAARQMAKDKAVLAAAMADVDMVYFSGITLAVLDDASRENLFAALRNARAAGKIIAFDPNLRPRLWAETSDMTNAIMQGAAISDIALPSFEDEETWFKDKDPKATADRYAAAGATTIVVKNGADSVYYQSNGASGEVAVPALTSVVDTTAAGDSFNAMVLAGLLRGDDLPSCINKACELAGLVVRGKGALVPIDPIQLKK